MIEQFYDENDTAHQSIRKFVMKKMAESGEVWPQQKIEDITLRLYSIFDAAIL